MVSVMGSGSSQILTGKGLVLWCSEVRKEVVAEQRKSRLVSIVLKDTSVHILHELGLVPLGN